MLVVGGWVVVLVVGGWAVVLVVKVSDVVSESCAELEVVATSVPEEELVAVDRATLVLSRSLVAEVLETETTSMWLTLAFKSAPRSEGHRK